MTATVDDDARGAGAGALHWATGKMAVEAVLGRRPGVIVVVANPVAQTAVTELDKLGVEVVMLTGDKAATAQLIA